VAAVWRPRTHTIAFAVFADTGGRFDEVSVRLQQDLGGSPFVQQSGSLRAKRNIDDKVYVVPLPNVIAQPRLDKEAWRLDIKRQGGAAFGEWGGFRRLEQCAP
jgi:hypothetical protein